MWTMNKNGFAGWKLLCGSLFGTFFVYVFMASAAYATATVIPTGPYVPSNPSANDTQHLNVQAGNSSLNASSSGVDINVPGVGSLQADQNGANISFSGSGLGTILLLGLLFPFLAICLVALLFVLIRRSRR
jgi:hypothetical protein